MDTKIIFKTLLFTIVSAFVAMSVAHAGYSNSNHEYTNTITSIQDCEEEVEHISFNTPKECIECETHKEYSKPESITRVGNGSAVIVEEREKVKETKKVETVKYNVKFDDTICKDCEDSFEVPEASTPHSTEKETVITKIKNFVYDCITW